MIKPRILHLIASLSHGGAETLVLNLTNELSKLDCIIHLCAFGQNISDDLNNLSWRLKGLNCQVKVIESAGLYRLETYVKVRDYILAEKIQLIHTHLSDADILGNFIGRNLNLPVFTTLHNLPAEYQGQRKSRSWPIRNFVSVNATKLISISKTIENEFSNDWHLSSDRIYTISNAVDLSVFLEKKPRLQMENEVRPLIVTTIGRLEPQKAQHIFLLSAYEVLKNRSDIEFRIVGDGPLKSSLEAQAKELGISENVKFLGLRDDIPSLLQQSDIFVLSSLWEGLPISAIEAMAASCALVLTDVGGNKDLIAHGEDGYLIEANNVQCLSNAILMLASDPQLIETWGNRARGKALQNFDISASAAAHLQLYQKILSKNRGESCESQ